MGSKKRSQERALEAFAEGRDCAASIDGGEDGLTTDDVSPGAAPHPEEMRGAVELRITDHVMFRATARATPAGLVGAAMLLSAILIPIMWRRRRN